MDMKKTLLAVLIPALFATSAQAVEMYKTDSAEVNFYGQLRTRAFLNESEDFKLDVANSRAGVTASYVVNDSLTVDGKVEFGVTGDMANRLHYVGFDTDYGKVTLGRQWVVADHIWGADYSWWFGGTAILTEQLSEARHDSLIKYNLDTENFWIAAGVGLNEDDSEQEYYETFVGTSFGAMNLNAGFTSTEDNVDGSDYEGLKSVAYVATVDYTIADTLVGFSYSGANLEETDGDREIDSTGYSLTVSHNLTDALEIHAGAELTTYDTTNITVDADDYKVAYVGFLYQINDFSKVWVEYGYSDGDTLGFANADTGRETDLGSYDSEHAAAAGYRIYW